MNRDEPVYLISIAARLCGVHPQTLRQYERLGFITPARVHEKNRLYCAKDVERVRQIQRLTQDLGVNLAGVEVILNLLDQIEDMRSDMESQLREFVDAYERRLAKMQSGSTVPVPRDWPNLPVPRIVLRRKT